MRPIDADELLDEICREQCERKFTDCDGMCEMAAVVVNAPTIGGWISVKDDMPKEHPSIFDPWYGSSQWKKAMWRKESYNVLLAYKTPDTGAYVIKEGRTHDGKFYSGNIVLDNDCEVTHWMEMPKPPKEG